MPAERCTSNASRDLDPYMEGASAMAKVKPDMKGLIDTYALCRITMAHCAMLATGVQRYYVWLSSHAFNFHLTCIHDSGLGLGEQRDSVSVQKAMNHYPRK